VSVTYKSDMYLRIGRRLETGRRSESYIYIINLNKTMLLFLLLIGREKKMGGSCLNRVFPRNTQHDDKGKFNNKTWEVPV
jgi:hypothetical protein